MPRVRWTTAGCFKAGASAGHSCVLKRALLETRTVPLRISIGPRVWPGTSSGSSSR